jgi:exodeoxyribonuclease-3
LSLVISTWNVNSVRLRLDNIAALAEEHNPDVICLQETKVVNDSFPRDALADLGYPHQVINGVKGYNGVAILSRLPFVDSGCREWCGKADGRHAWAALENGVEVDNFYVPAGGDVPDPLTNDKFAHKLDFLAEMTNWFAARKAPDNKLVLVGDLNVAPLENDVWSHTALLKVVSHTPVEVEAMTALMAAGDWIDAMRRFVPPEESLYSWWSYRARDWDDADKGRRLDHVWVTPALGDALDSIAVLRDARGWEKPSDHVPVTVTMTL